MESAQALDLSKGDKASLPETIEPETKKHIQANPKLYILCYLRILND